MKQIAVFDFDKTLTYKDSLGVIFKSRMTGHRKIYRPVYFILQVLSKLGIISPNVEKELMMKLLFKSSFNLYADQYKKIKSSIKVTPILEKLRSYSSSGWRVIVISASEQSFLEYFFSDYNNIEIIGATLQLENDRIINIVRHPYGLNKRKILESMEIKTIDEFYFDSKSDECLLPLSVNSYKIKQGIIVKRFRFRLCVADMKQHRLRI